MKYPKGKLKFVYRGGGSYDYGYVAGTKRLRYEDAHDWSMKGWLAIVTIYETDYGIDEKIGDIKSFKIIEGKETCEKYIKIIFENGEHTYLLDGKKNRLVRHENI